MKHPMTLKPLLAILSLISFAAFSPLWGDVLLQTNDVVAINGDKISSQFAYTLYIEEYLLACDPVRNVRVINFAGSGGANGTTGEFDGRIENEILPFKPTVVTTFFGVNDGHHMQITKENQDAYRQSLTSAFKKLKSSGVRKIFVGGPGCVDPSYYDSSHYNKSGVTPDGYNATLKDLSDIACDVAKQDGDVFVNIYDAMMTAMTKMKAAKVPDSFFEASTGFYPQAPGQLPIAYAFLKAFGCDGAIGTIAIDLTAKKAEGTPGHKITLVKDGSITIESTRYPFCFVGGRSPAKALPYLPFNEELNRYLLIVKGLKNARAKVTWGTESKEFAAADLEKGINLAAEFLKNPFCDKFDQLQNAVLAKQGTEVGVSWNTLHNINYLKRSTDSAHTETIDQLVPSCIDLQKKFSDIVAALVTPVTHTIVIEPVQ